MKKIILPIFIALFLITLVSADIIINEQPNEVYNLGDSVNVPVTIKATTGITQTFQMDLICQGLQVNFYKNGVSLTAGQEKRIDSSLILTKEIISETTGTCKIKGSLGSDYVLTNEFEISDLINIQSKVQEIEFNPGQSILIHGSAKKENGQDVNGYVNLEIVSGNTSQNINKLGTINNGLFSINLTFPKNMKAGTYLVKLNTYETDSNSITTNKGFMNYNILIKQIPTSLDLIFETTQVEPGTNLKVKAILLDQTGEKIDSIAIITVKKGNNNILEQTEKSTNEYLEFPVAYNEPASNWTVVAVSNKLTKESKFKIIEKKDVKIERINETIIITNNGNIPYNDEIVIKIGNKTLSINISLGIDETERYELKAPDGEYYIEVISGGKRKLSENAILTGKTIDIKELRQAGKSAMSHPVVWIFIIAILAFVAFMFLKKGYKRSFFGKMKFKKKDKPMNSSWENHKSNTERKITFDSKNPAHLSLSIKGEKQSSGILCLKLKNIKELNFKEGNVKENIEEIIKFAEDKKASTYETQENLFFIFSPTKTKTFKNEKTILDLAQKIKEKLKHHNRLFKQKIDYGLSIHHGDLIVSHQAKGMSFMGMGNLISQAKKISGISKGEILLDEKTKEKLGKTVKTEKFTQENLIFYRIKEIKDTEEHSKFLSNFVKKLESDKKEREL